MHCRFGRELSTKKGRKYFEVLDVPVANKCQDRVQRQDPAAMSYVLMNEKVVEIPKIPSNQLPWSSTSRRAGSRCLSALKCPGPCLKSRSSAVCRAFPCFRHLFSPCSFPLSEIRNYSVISTMALCAALPVFPADFFRPSASSSYDRFDACATKKMKEAAAAATEKEKEGRIL